MITIYSVDSEGRLFTDPKQHFFIDAGLLREKATALRIKAALDEIAKRFSWKDGDQMTTYLTCSGHNVDDLILSGKLVEVLTR